MSATVTPPNFSIVVVNYNANEDLSRCVEALSAQTFDDFDLTIVDNSDESPYLPQYDNKLGQRTHLHRSGANLGFAGGCNLGAMHTSAPWLVFLNPDCRPAPDWLAQLSRATLDFPEVQMLCSTQIMAEDTLLLDGVGDAVSIFGLAWRGGYGQPSDLAPAAVAEVFGACGAAMAIRRDVFEALGGFQERFFCYLEDVDLSVRHRMEGGKCLVIPGATVAHVGSATTGRESVFQLFHSARNRLWMIASSFPLILLPLSLPLAIALEYRASQVALDRQARDARRRGLWAGIKGLGHALRQRRWRGRHVFGHAAFWRLVSSRWSDLKRRPIITRSYGDEASDLD